MSTKPKSTRHWVSTNRRPSRILATDLSDYVTGQGIFVCGGVAI